MPFYEDFIPDKENDEDDDLESQEDEK